MRRTMPEPRPARNRQAPTYPRSSRAYARAPASLVRTLSRLRLVCCQRERIERQGRLMIVRRRTRWLIIERDGMSAWWGAQ